MQRVRRISSSRVTVAIGTYQLDRRNQKIQKTRSTLPRANVEAILNSRPLTATFNDPNDGKAIIPAYLLIGTSLQALPDQKISEKISTLTQYQRITYLKQRLWHLWRRDYLHELQLRSKWLKAESNERVCQLVLVHEDILTPQQWQLARITSMIPGSSCRS
ncbi:hypothetical protein ACLKA7_007705 [Drosophila subpalustris]